MWLQGHLPVATPHPPWGCETSQGDQVMSGCKGSYSLGVGEGLPACLSVSVWVSEFQKCVLFVPPHPLLRLWFFKV